MIKRIAIHWCKVKAQKAVKARLCIFNSSVVVVYTFSYHSLSIYQTSSSEVIGKQTSLAHFNDYPPFDRREPVFEHRYVLPTKQEQSSRSKKSIYLGLCNNIEHLQVAYSKIMTICVTWSPRREGNRKAILSPCGRHILVMI